MDAVARKRPRRVAAWLLECKLLVLLCSQLVQVAQSGTDAAATATAAVNLLIRYVIPLRVLCALVLRA